MDVEIEFDFPSFDFFDKMREFATTLPLVPLDTAKEFIERSGSVSVVQTLFELIVRLKVEVVRDFEAYEAERQGLPYVATFKLTMERENAFQYLAIRTVLKSRHAHPGGAQYGSAVFKVGEDAFVSEDHYGD